jgi:hypothetical protein
MYRLNQMIERVDSPTHLMMTKNVRLVLTEAANTTGISGYIRWEKDEFGRPIALYRDLPILIADENGVDLPAIDETESTDKTSIYCMSLGGEGIEGIENGGMDVRDLGELDTKPVFRTRVEWYVGIVCYGPRCAARLSTIAPGSAAVRR